MKWAVSHGRAGNTDVGKRFVGKISAPELLPSQLMSFSVCSWKRNPGKKWRLTPDWRRGQSGYYRNADYSSYSCPCSSALPWSHFAVRSSTGSSADDWLPGAPHWHRCLVPPANGNSPWAGRAGPPGVNAAMAGACCLRLQVHLQPHRWTPEGKHLIGTVQQQRNPIKGMFSVTVVLLC